jgi:hypothetical protein
MQDASAIALLARQGADAAERREFLAYGLSSFERFAGLCDIVPKAGPRIKLRLNAIQREYCANRTPRDIVLKPRQIGFTTMEQARDIFHFLTVPGARVVATCQSITDHTPQKLLAKNYRVIFQSLARLGLQLNFRTETASEWTLADRDASLRIVEAGASEAAAEKKGRAGTISRLHLTETAFYEYAEETLNALLECVPSPEAGSEIVSESTPNGAAGTYFEQYRAAAEGRSGYTAHFYPWFQQPEYRAALRPGEVVEPEDERQEQLVERHGISRAQLKWYQQKVAEKKQDLVDQEYPSDPSTCFLVSGRLFFDRTVTATLHAKASPPAFTEMGGALRIWKRAVPGRQYVISADPSEGTGGDPGAAVVYERATAEHVATLHGQFPTWEMGRLLATLARSYNNALIAVERNNHGTAVLQALEQGEKYLNVYRADDEKAGWYNVAVRRSAALEALENAHRTGEWSTPDVESTAELLTFIVDRTGKAVAQRGTHDDLTMAHAIAFDVLRKPLQTITAPKPRAPAYRMGSGRGFG